MTEQDLAGLHALLRDDYPEASKEEIAQLILLRLTDEQALDLASIALAREDTMEAAHTLALRVVRAYVEEVDPGPRGDPGMSSA